MLPRVAAEEVDQAMLSSRLTGMDVASRMLEPEERADVCVLAKSSESFC